MIFGPTRLPSAHLAELRETGRTVLPGFGPRTLAAMKYAIHTSFFEAVTDLSVGTDRPSRALQLHIPKAATPLGQPSEQGGDSGPARWRGSAGLRPNERDDTLRIHHR